MKMDTYLRGRGQIIFPGILAAKVLPPAPCSGWVVTLGGFLFSHKIDFLTFVKEEKISGNFLLTAHPLNTQNIVSVKNVICRPPLRKKTIGRFIHLSLV